MKLTGVENYKIAYRLHASERMFAREISDKDVEWLLKQGEIIERYDDDYPLPSLLINGYTTNNRPLHPGHRVRETHAGRPFDRQLKPFSICSCHKAA